MPIIFLRSRGLKFLLFLAHAYNQKMSRRWLKKDANPLLRRLRDLPVELPEHFSK